MENLTTQDSLKIIQTVINQRKRQYEENGKFLLFWGVLIMMAGISQFIMIKMGYGNISGFAWFFTMIPGAIITYISAYLDSKKAIKNHESLDLMGWLWGFAGAMALISGFLFGNKFGIAITFTIFIPFCIAAMASALQLKNYLWIFLTIIAAIIAYGSLFTPYLYHPLISALIAFLVFLLPGLQLHLNHKKRQNV